MRKIKKTIYATTLSLTLALGVPYAVLNNADTVFATDVVLPSASDTASITIKNVTKGSTVTAYHIVEATYSTESGLLSYQQTNTSKAVVTIENIEKIKATEVTEIAKAITAGNLVIDDKVSLTYDETTSSYVTANAKAGSYIVLVEAVLDSEDENFEPYIYNPMWVSNVYEDSLDASTLGAKTKDGVVDAAGDNTLVTTGTIWAKRSRIPFDKYIENASTGYLDIEDVKVGDTVTFCIETEIPDYSEHYTNTEMVIHDEQSAGLSEVTIKDVVIVTTDSDDKEIETAIAADGYTVSKSGNDFDVTLTSDWVKTHAYSNVRIRYTADITKDAVTVNDKNTNTATLTYYNTPTTKSTYTDEVSLFSFEVTSDFVKVGTDGSVVVDSNNVVKAGNDALAGAVFELTQLSDRNGELLTPIVWEAVSDANGKIDKWRLKGSNGAYDIYQFDEGTYSLKETQTIKNHKLNTDTYTITVTPEYNVSGTEFKSLTVTMTNDRTNKVVTSIHSTINDESAVNGVGIVNENLAELPSTGGNGTKLFTIFGIFVMAVGVTLTFKKKKN